MIRGDFNTHSSKSKPANDVLIKIFKRENLSTAVVNKLNDSSSVEGMVEIIKEHNFMQVFDRIADDVQSSAERYILSKANIGTILFDMRKNIIGVSKGFKDWQRSL